MPTKNVNESSRLKRAAEHPILSGLAVALIVAICGSIWATAKGAWPAVLSATWSGISFAWHWLGSTTEVWNWLLIVLTLTGLGAASAIAYVAWQSQASATPLTQKDYTSDSFEGLRWYWSYDYFGSVSGIHACCPECHLQLEPKYVSSLNFGDRITYDCEHCGTTRATFKEHHNKLESRIERFIHKKLRTGEWKTVKKPTQVGSA